MGKFTIFVAMAMLVIATLVASIAVPSSYLIMEPGPAMDVGPMIAIPDHYGNARGNIYLTSVSIRSATLAQWAFAQFDPSVRILPKDDVTPQDITPEDYQRIQVALLEESKTVAKIVALRQLGYDVQVSGQGVKVEAILPNSPAKDKLKAGDTIIGLNGQKMEAATQLIDAMGSVKPGETVNLTIMRDNQQMDVQSGTIESTSQPGQAMLGVLITSRTFQYTLPFDIRIDTENLAGPSAGQMFTLGIIDALTPTDLTKGHKIAGTGTIAIDGTIGKIDGARQKVLGAERAGAEYFLAPTDNYEEAKAAAHKIQVVPVKTIDDSLKFLSSLEEKTAAEKAPVGAVSAQWIPAW